VNKVDLSQLTILGFDFGTRRIGVAVGQLITQSATPLTILKAVDGVPDWNEIKKLIEVWRIGALVVGAPYNMDGSEQRITEDARQFAEILEAKFQLPVYHMDERLTTKEAGVLYFEKGLRERKSQSDLDSIAAKIILESWLRQHSGSR
jgi:putative Holliday junction resolvase